MAEYTAFGLEVKAKLLGPPTRTQSWLAEQVSLSTGMYVDSAYLSRILTGQRTMFALRLAVRAVQLWIMYIQILAT